MSHGKSAGRERQARIRWEYAPLYPGLVAGEWMPAWLLAEKLMAHSRQHSSDPDHRLCDPSHCEFRGGGPRPPEFRGLRTRALDRRSAGEQ
jgi:hypothetical protein